MPATAPYSLNDPSGAMVVVILFPNVSLPSRTVIAVATVARQAGLLKPVNWRTPV